MKNDNRDAIRQANQKALPKFILTLLCSIIVGGIIGFSAAFFGVEGLRDGLATAGNFFAIRLSPWLLTALPAVELAACLPIYSSAKKRLERWDGEDEEESGSIEGRLSACIWISGTVNILAFFLLAASFSGFRAMKPWAFFLGLGMFLLTLIVNIVLQQCFVDAAKQLNPEKQGSVYDMKFQKTWLGSCDEAERAIIGQCAIKAYEAVSRTCLTLWALSTLAGLFFDMSFLPSLAVCIIWGVSQSVYCYWSIKLSNPGAASPL